MAEEYKTDLHRWFEEVWNKKREEAIDEMLSEDTVHHGLGDQPVRGIENYKNFYRTFITAFPDIRVEVMDVMTDGEKISARYVARATHAGEGLGFAPTQKQVEFTGMGICTMKDGKFVEVWNQVDFMNMYSQLGVLKLNLE